MGRRGRGWLLFWLAAAAVIPATLLGLSKSGRPVWESARGLFAIGGAVLMIYGALVWHERAEWIGLGADQRRRTGLILGVAGTAALGVGLEQIAGAQAWRLLTIPAIVGFGLLSLVEAWRGKRGAMYRLNRANGGPWWSVRGGLWMFGLSWPVLVLWAVGLESFQ